MVGYICPRHLIQYPALGSTMPFDLPPKLRLFRPRTALGCYNYGDSPFQTPCWLHQNLNSAIDGTSMADQDIEEILSKCADNPVRNNGGGYWNHCFFWDSMCPPDQSLGPSGALMDAINDAFGSFEEFKSKFKAAALTRFGSGWAWLCSDSGALTICSTANQDNPLMETVGCGQTPILGIDVWEHAYYKKFGLGRGDYVEAWWNVVNWTKVEDRFNSTIQ